MDEIDRKLLAEAEKGLPLTTQPFSAIASAVGITTQEAIKRLQKLQEAGVIRRFGASIRPNDVGFCANALVAWKIPEKQVVEAANYFSRHSKVSHCYERHTIPGKWEYNFYTVLHAQKRENLEEIVREFSESMGLRDFVVLYSTRNLKALKQEKMKC